MSEISANKRSDVVNLYLNGLSEEQVSTNTKVDAEDVEGILQEFLSAAKRLYELEMETGKNCNEIIEELKELMAQREELIGDITDMHCM